MKRTKWMVGTILGALMTLPAIGCGGDGAGPAPGGDDGSSPIGEAEGRWAITPVGASSTTTANECLSRVLFEVTAAEAIDFVAVEASQDLAESVTMRVYRMDEAKQLHEVHTEAELASRLKHKAEASARKQDKAKSVAKAEQEVNELVQSDSTAYAYSRKQAESEANASHRVTEKAITDATETASASQSASASSSANLDVDQSAKVSQSEVASALDAACGFGLCGGSGIASMFESFFGKAAARESIHAKESQSASQGASASQSSTVKSVIETDQLVQDHADSWEAVEAETFEELHQKNVYHLDQEAAELAATESSSLTEAEESVVQVLEQYESLDDTAFDSTIVTLTDNLDQEHLFVEVVIQEALQKAAASQRAEAKERVVNLSMLTGTFDSVFATGVFPAVIPGACVP